MIEIIELLNEEGLAVLNVSLAGHGANYDSTSYRPTASARMESFQSVTKEQWQTEVYDAYGEARALSQQKQLPLFFVGFSIGGLIGCDLLVSHPRVWFDKMVLFAPALKLRFAPHLSRIVAPFPRMIIPSFTPDTYRSNYGTPLAAYNACFQLLRHFELYCSRKLDIPTLIFLDRKDEFISYSGLRTMIHVWSLSRWKIAEIHKTPSSRAYRHHHLIIDSKTVGTETWEQMKNKIRAHLFV
ncbi:alpha/beta hydrolase [Deltaproteobacteria bacterium TL4]